MMGPLLARAAHGVSVVLNEIGVARASRGLHVLLYHGIGAGTASCLAALHDELPLATFTQQLDWLEARYQCVALEDGLAQLQAGADRPLACITFDDGLASMATQAAPALHARGVPAAVFLNAAVIDNVDLLWQHLLSYLLTQYGLDSVWTALCDCTHWPDRPPATTHGVIQTCQRRYADVHRTRAIDQVASRFGVDRRRLARAERAYLTTAQIATLARQGVTFYSHTARHLPLAAVSDTEMRAEIDEAHRILAVCPETCDTVMSFPFGMRSDYGSAGHAYALTRYRYVVEVEDGWNPRGRVRRTRTVGRVAPKTADPVDLYAALEVLPLFKGVLNMLRRWQIRSTAA